MRTYEELQKLLDEELGKAVYGRVPETLYEPVKYTMNLGGKRLRPVLLLMACNVFDEDVAQALPAAHAIELFHNFTLVHDDIMDNAPTRRGQPTVYTKWNMPVAILSGDIMMIKAYQELCKTQHKGLPKLLQIFNRAATEVCEGQQLDMNFESQEQVSHDEYINMIALKTSVLLAASLKIGAYIGGADRTDAQHLYDFGRNIGIAFQIQDDLLDSFGDGQLTGKRVGGDIMANKKTLLLIELTEAAHKDDKKLLIEKAKSSDESKVEIILKLFEKYQVREFAEEKKAHYLQLAFQHLGSVKVQEERKSVLRNTALQLMNRIS